MSWSKQESDHPDNKVSHTQRAGGPYFDGGTLASRRHQVRQDGSHDSTVSSTILVFIFSNLAWTRLKVSTLSIKSSHSHLLFRQLDSRVMECRKHAIHLQRDQKKIL